MGGFDPKAFLGDSSVQAPTPQAGNPLPQPSSPASSFDPQNFLAAQTDPVTGGDRPFYANGLTPDTALNTAPKNAPDGSGVISQISGAIDKTAERFKVAWGNSEGAVKYLKSQYEDARLDNKGKVVVKQDGMWHRFDPQGTGDGDPWERTTEVIKDMADALPSGFKAGTTGAIAAAAATGGAAAIPAYATGFAVGAGMEMGSDEISQFIKDNAGKLGVGAAYLTAAGLYAEKGKDIIKGGLPAAIGAGLAKTGQVVMGKLYGTYDATPEEVLKDIGMDTGLTMLMAFPAAGMKPTVNNIADLLRKGQPMAEKMTEGAKSIWSKVVGSATGAGEGNAQRMLENLPDVAKELKMSNGSAEQITRTAIQELNKVGENSQNVASAIWRKGMNKLAAAAENQNLESNTQDIVREIHLDGVRDGIGEFVRKSEGAAPQTYLGEYLKGAPKSTSSMEPVSPEEISAWIAKGERALPEGVTFRLKPFEEIVADRKAGRNFAEAINSEKTYDYFKELFKNLENYNELPSEKGAAGVKQLLSFKKAVGDSIRDLGNKAKEDGATSALQLIKGKGKILSDLVDARFEGPSKALYNSMNEDYSVAKDAGYYIQRASEKYSQGDVNAVESFLKQISAKPGFNIGKKEGIEKMAELAASVGRQDVADAANNVLNKIAAKAFLPRFRPGLGDKVALGAAAAAATATGHPMAAGALVAATSPRLALRTSQAGQALVQSSLKGLGFLKGLPREQMEAFVQNPQMMQTFFSTIVKNPDMAKQIKDSLVMGALQSTQPTPTPLPPPNQKGK